MEYKIKDSWLSIVALHISVLTIHYFNDEVFTFLTTETKEILLFFLQLLYIIANEQ